MGKTLAILVPFIIAGILVLFYLFYRAGKAAARLDGTTKEHKMLQEADEIFHHLLVTSSLDTDDILTEKSRREITAWRSKYEKV